MRNLLFIIFLIIFISCESKVKYQKPDNLIPREQMIALLIDMHIASGTTTVRDRSNRRERNYMSLVYEKYQIDSTRLADSNFYYISNIEEYESIFKEVQKQLKMLEEESSFFRDTVNKSNLDSIRKKQKRPKKLGEKYIFK